MEALHGLAADARDSDRQLLYFTSGTYSETALVYADRMGIALFSYDRAGFVSHVNAAAMAAILAAPDVTSPPEPPEAARPGPTADVRASDSSGHEPDMQAWAVSAWRARHAPTPRWTVRAYLPVAVSLLVGLLTLATVRAWQTGAEPTPGIGAVVVAVLALHASCVWSVAQVARRRSQAGQHRLDTMRACIPPDDARALVHAAMQRSGRGVPEDREALVLLRNEVSALSELDAFTAGVIVWEVTVGNAGSADQRDWLDAPPTDDSVPR